MSEPRTTPLAHFPAQILVTEQIDQNRSQALAIISANEIAVLAVLDDVRDAAVRAADDWFAERHGFQKNKPEAFAATGHGENLTAVVERDKL